MAANFEEAARLTAAGPMAGYGGLLGRLADPERHRVLHATLAAGAFDAGDRPEQELTFGLETGSTPSVRARG